MVKSTTSHIFYFIDEINYKHLNFSKNPFPKYLKCSRNRPLDLLAKQHNRWLFPFSSSLARKSGLEKKSNFKRITIFYCVSHVDRQIHFYHAKHNKDQQGNDQINFSVNLYVHESNVSKMVLFDYFLIDDELLLSICF